MPRIPVWICKRSVRVVTEQIEWHPARQTRRGLDRIVLRIPGTEINLAYANGGEERLCAFDDPHFGIDSIRRRITFCPLGTTPSLKVIVRRNNFVHDILQ